MITKRPARKRRAPRAMPAAPRGSWPMLSTRRVLVATDGSDAARAALQFARSMEERGAWSPEVLTVLEPVPVSVAEVAFAAPSLEYQNLVTESALKRIMRQLRRYGSGEWKLDTRFGSPASSILDAATEHDAEMIVLGLGRHGRLARLFGAETAARVARRSSTVVLAVDPGAELFRTAVVAIDFGASSLRAAQEALHLLTPPARLHLVHVRWAFEGETMREPTWERTYAEGVAVEFDRLVTALGRHPGLRVTHEFRLGNVTASVLDVAKEAGADLIAAGSHNQNVVDRLLIGSTPSHLLRAAPCSVLIAPPREAAG